MTEVKCIACNKLNSAGDRFCAGCGSSLDLQLCGACEAINNPVAETCHSCGKPLLAQAVVSSTLGVDVAEAPEAPFYPPRRWEVYDARPSLASRLGHAAKLIMFVALPLAAIAVWAHQLYGERLFRGSEPIAQMPAAAGVTAPVPEPVVQAKPPVVETKPPVVQAKLPVVEAKPPVVEAKQPAVETRQPVAETKRPLAQAQAPAAAPARRARTVTHTAVTAVAPAAPVLQDKPPAVEAPPAAPMTRGRVTHTRASAAVAPAVPALPAAAQPPAAAGCPEAVAVLGLCTSNQKGEGK